MFAPPMPASGSRRPSAIAHNTYAHHPYDLPSSPSSREQPPKMLDHSGSPAWSPPYEKRRRSSQAPLSYDMPAEADHVEVASQTQDHMNVVTKHPKVKIEVVLDSPIFEAGGSISGKIELTCTTSQRLRLGELAIELEAVEQLTSRDHAATQLFLYNRTMFQGDGLPPSNAVVPSGPINGYWSARKGRTAFAFTFRLPSSIPSCVNFAGNASLRYGLKATVQTWYNDEKMVVTARRQAFVLEKWSDEHDPRYLEPVEAVSDTRLFMGGNGTVSLEAGVSEQLFWAGGQIILRCAVKNNTKRHLSGIKVSLARRLIFPVGSPEGIHDTPEAVPLEPRVTELSHEQIFKGRDYEFGPNEESVCNVAVEIPKDMRTIRKTRLFEVRIFAIVSLILGSLAKDLTIEIPIYVAHTASTQRPARQDLRDLHRSPPQPQIPHRPHSSVGHGQPSSSVNVSQPHNPHHGYQPHGIPPTVASIQGDPRILEVEQFAADRGWSPAAFTDQSRPLGPPMRSASAAPGMMQVPNHPLTVLPNGQIDWIPATDGWNTNPFAVAISHEQQIPRSASAAPDAFQLSTVRPSSAGSIAPPMYAQPILPAQHSAWSSSQQNEPAAQQQQAEWQLQQEQQARRSSLPMPGLYGSTFAQPSNMTMPAVSAAGYAAPEQQSEQVESQIQAVLAAQPPAGFVPPPPVVAGLATIEEDSESQAGTIKTMRNLPTLGKTGTKNSKGNSVSRNNIEQFEAMAEAEEDEEEVKRQMIAMGMQPDEASFSVRSKNSPVVKEAGKQRIPAHECQTQQDNQAEAPPSSTSSRQSAKSQSAASNTNRPRAVDIFNAATSPLGSDFGSNSTDEWKAHHDDLNKLALSQDVAKVTIPTSSVASEELRTSLTSLRRTSSSQGVGLEALESKLHRTTTPKLSSSGSCAPATVLGNVGKREAASTSLAVATSRDDSTRSRKDSALRAAALAREEAERKALEEEIRAAEERKRRQEAEEAARIEAAKAEAARIEAEQVRALEKERLERERAAEQARLERLRAERLRADQEEQELQELRARQQEIEAEQARLAQLEEQRKRREEAAAIAAAEASQLRLQQQQQQQQQEQQQQQREEAKREQQRLIGRAEEERRRYPAPSNSYARTSSSQNVQDHHNTDRYGARSDSHTSWPDRYETGHNMPQSSSFTVIKPKWEEATLRREAVIPKSKTIANIVRSSANTEMEDTPELSAELRALIDGAGVQPARKAGTALKDHPITRKISVTDRPDQATQDLTDSSRNRQIPMPSWPQRGLLNSENKVGQAPHKLLDTFDAAHGSYSAAQGVRRAQGLFSGADKAIVVPNRVEKTLKAPEEPKSDLLSIEGERSYDTRSARGGRGGRVASVAQLWSRIAGDDEAADQVMDLSNADAQATTHKPHARRTSAPALDFSKKKFSHVSTSMVTGLSINAVSTSPADLKSTNAAQFLNTSSTAKPVFSTVAANRGQETGARRPLPKPVTQPGSTPAPQLVRPTAMRANSSQKQVQTTSTLDSRSVRNTMSKVAVDQSVLQALQGDYSIDMDMSTLRLADGTEVKMSGRGTTKAIGNGKLESLRAVWGS